MAKSDLPAVRATTTLAKFTPLVVAELQRIEADLGGRQQVVGMLALAPLTPDLRQVLLLLGDPDKASCSLAEICALKNVLPGDLIRHLTSAALLRGKVQAAQHIGQGIGKVAQDIMERAAPREDTCSYCQGCGTIIPPQTSANMNPEPEQCTVCRGSGRLRYPADPEAQKLAVEMAQLLPKGGGLNIMQVNAPGGGGDKGGGGALDAVLRMSDQVLYGTGLPEGTVDGEVVHGEDAAEDADAPPA